MQRESARERERERDGQGWQYQAGIEIIDNPLTLSEGKHSLFLSPSLSL